MRLPRPAGLLEGCVFLPGGGPVWRLGVSTPTVTETLSDRVGRWVMGS